MWKGLLSLFLGLAIIGWWWTGPSSDETVVYSASCANDIAILPFGLVNRSFDSFEEAYAKHRADRENCVILPLNRTVYKLNEARGEVYYRIGDSDPARLVNCALFSYTNWTCSYPDGSGKVVILDGLRAIHAEDVKGPTKPHFSLRRWQWWAATLYWFVGKPQSHLLIPEQREHFASASQQ